MLSALLPLAALLTGGGAAPAADPASASLHDHLQRSFADIRDEWPDTTYVAAFADLDGNGSAEALVSFGSSYFCGSGGCALHIYTPEGDGWREVAELTIVNAPVRLLGTRTRGWRDLAVQVRGGGTEIPYEARIRFDGRTYASNPSMAPRVRGGAPGEVLIDDAAEARPLFRDGPSPELRNPGDAKGRRQGG